VEDRVLDRDPHPADADLEEPRSVVRDVDADEARLAVVPADEGADVQPERRHVRERRRRPDRDRSQQREQLALDALRERPQLARPAVLDRRHADSARGERRPQVVEPERLLSRLELHHGRARRGERLRRGAPVGRAGDGTGRRLLRQLGHAHREELVEVRRDDRAELHALEQRQRRVRGELEHAAVEVDPRQLAVEEPPERDLGHVRHGPDGRGRADVRGLTGHGAESRACARARPSSRSGERVVKPR
jgi:hypothetical protein